MSQIGINILIILIIILVIIIIIIIIIITLMSQIGINILIIIIIDASSSIPDICHFVLSGTILVSKHTQNIMYVIMYCHLFQLWINKSF